MRFMAFHTSKPVDIMVPLCVLGFTANSFTGWADIQHLLGSPISVKPMTKVMPSF
jgi:hypothetical protein